MKLFGNRRKPDHLQRGGEPGARSAGRRLTGLQLGLILLAACLLMLTGAVFAVYQTFVKPVEFAEPAPPPAVLEEPEPEEEVEEVFVPPTVVETQVEVDEETGEETSLEVEVPASHKEGFYNILIVGTDGDGGRTDTIMIARLDTRDHTVALMSIPRDTLISGTYAVPKINSVYASGGRGEKGIAALRTKLAQLLGFQVDAYAMVNLDAFIELVDLVGGVMFNVPMDMDYEDSSQDLYIHLKAGPQLLDGEKAMQLVRFRKGYATQDIMRTQVQQQFLQALAKKCLSVVNLAKIGDMAEIFLEHVTTDLTLGNIIYFGQELLKCDFENMYTYTLEGEAVMLRGASCYALYLNKTLKAVNAYFNPYEAEITADHVTIRTPEEARAEQAEWLAQQPPAEEEPPETDSGSDPELPELEDPWGEEEADPEEFWPEEPEPDEFWPEDPFEGWEEPPADFEEPPADFEEPPADQVEPLV